MKGASFVAQLVKNAMWETCVQSLGWKDPLEKGKATQSSILVRRIPMDGIVHGVAISCVTGLGDWAFIQEVIKVNRGLKDGCQI